jgi:hypothetical protein
MMTTHTIRVFISYAWESEAHKAAVWDLAGWLEANSNGEIKIITDHLFENRPPTQGWPAWIQQEVDKADIVLIVCSPLYKTRFQKEDDVAGGGAGVNFEGAIINQVLYNTKLRNDKFFPILPDGGERTSIPTILQAFDNNHVFPSGNDRILKLIYNDNPTHLTEISNTLSAAPTETKNGELEKEIVNVITEALDEDTKSEEKMLTPIQIIVRSFLLLSDGAKITIAKNLKIFDPAFNGMRPVDRDKAIFKLIKENNLLHNLWDQVNAINPFEDANNPFKNNTHELHS